MNGMSLAVGGAIARIAVLVCLLSQVTAIDALGVNLVQNPGFEIGSGNTPASWLLGEGAEGNRFDWVQSDSASDEVHSGNRSLRMRAINSPAPGSSMAVTSSSFRVPAHCRVETSVWIKASNVVNRGDVDWYGLRVTLAAYSVSGIIIEHRDLMNEEGSFSWMKIQGEMNVPEGTVTVDLSIKLTTCTGTVWVDDAEVKMAQELPAVDLTGIYNPVVVPQPWQIKPGSGTLPLGDVGIVNQSNDVRIKDAIDAFFTSRGVVHKFVANGDSTINTVATKLILGDGSDPVLDKELSSRFSTRNWSNLGDQGYFLAVDRVGGQNCIYAGANGDTGRFYAIQTLGQLVVDTRIYVVDIFDAPTVGCRGIAMGLQWFDERNDEALKRLTELKLNFVWAQGSFLDDYLNTDNWRLDFTASQKTILKEFIELYRKSFIEVWMVIGPRGKNPPLQYSSDSDINTVVKKMDALYALGLRHLGLHFDDLVNVQEDKLLVQKDIEVFHNDIGAAQVYFVNEVYSRLKTLHPDVHFMVVPMDYNQAGNYGDKSAASLRLGQFSKLPAEVGVYPVAYYDEDIMAITSLTGRSSVPIVSSFYADGDTQPGEYVVPFLSSISWKDPIVRTKITGFTWVPRRPQSEDASLVSWHTAADCAWAPDRYDPERSFQLAAAKYLGVSDGNRVSSGSVAASR